MTPQLRSRTALATFAGLSVIGTLAGCAATSTGTTGSGTSGTGTTSSSNSSGSTSGSTTTSSTASYKDGTYSEPGSYVSPGGTEHIKVTLTLKSNLITAMKVVTVQADPTATGYEQQFEGGIGAATIGKNINTLKIGVVAGSSLTSQGFNKALAAIKADAKA